jgi:hypothetical protein
MNIMSLFSKKPLPPLVPYADVARYREAGYHTLPIERTQLDHGYEKPAGGGWLWPMRDPEHPEQFTLGIHCGVFPHEGGGAVTLFDCRRTWLALCRVSGFTDKRLARDVEAVLTGAGNPPVRATTGNLDLLVPFRVDAPDCRAINFRTQGFGGSFTIQGGPVCFMAGGGPFEWRNDRDLLAVRHDDLPLLTPEGARELSHTVDMLTVRRVA